MTLNQEVIDKEYGNGRVIKIFDNNLFQVKFEKKEIPILYGKDLKRFNSKNKLILKKDSLSNYKELNKLFSKRIYPEIDISYLKPEDFKYLFKNNSLDFNQSKNTIEKTINSVKKGRNFGESYLTSLGGYLTRNLFTEHVYLKNRYCIPSFIDVRYIKYIYLANKYSDNKWYNNLEIILPLYDSEQYSWINIESNTLNLKAFHYTNYIDINISNYEKADFNELDSDLRKKITKIGVYLKDNMVNIYKKENYYILKGCQINIFVGTTRDYINLKKELK